MLAQIICPSCSRKSQIAYEKLPPGKLKTTCQTCRKQFLVDKEQEVNCQILEQYAESGWEVRIPACQGMTYDLEDLAKLVRSGMVSRDTHVVPPGSRDTVPAARVAQLERAFEQWDQRNRDKS